MLKEHFQKNNIKNDLLLQEGVEALDMLRNSIVPLQE
jgi:hypothetical protein